MGVSQQIGSSSLSKPGVCTSSTRPATPYEGQMIYETDTDLSYIYNGSAWQQIAGGTAVGNSGLVYVTSATIGTTVSSVTVSSAFSTTYDNYKIVVGGGVASGTVSMGMILGANATNYYWSAVLSGYGAAPTVSATSGAGSAANWRVNDASTNSFHAIIELQSPNLAVRTTYQAMSGLAITTGYSISAAGFLNDAAQYTAFTFTPSSGTLTGGTITVYGYRKA